MLIARKDLNLLVVCLGPLLQLMYRKIPGINENVVASLSSGDNINVFDMHPDALTKDGIFLRHDYNGSRLHRRIMYSNYPVTDSTLLRELGIPQFIRSEETTYQNHEHQYMIWS